jgi:hypothetical protein
MGSRQSIDSDVIDSITGQGSGFTGRVLMGLNPCDTDGSADFFVEISDQGEKINVVRLSLGESAVTSDHFDFTDSRRTVNDPAKFTSMLNTPESSKSGDQKKWCSIPSQFAARGGP